MKEDSDEDEKIALVSYVNKSERWITSNGCSNHMSGDKSKFESIGPYKGGYVKFSNDVPCFVKG